MMALVYSAMQKATFVLAKSVQRKVVASTIPGCHGETYGG